MFIQESDYLIRKAHVIPRSQRNMFITVLYIKYFIYIVNEIGFKTFEESDNMWQNSPVYIYLQVFTYKVFMKFVVIFTLHFCVYAIIS